jgi:hypothetical protein
MLILKHSLNPALQFYLSYAVSPTDKNVGHPSLRLSNLFVCYFVSCFCIELHAQKFKSN